MSIAVTRAYMRGRLLFIMTGFLLAVALGATFVSWQAGASRTNVKYAAVLVAMSETTSDVIYNALALDQARLKAELERQKVRGTLTGFDDLEELSELASLEAQTRLELNKSVERLTNIYRAFAVNIDGEVQTGESQRNANAERPSTIAPPTQGGADFVLEEISGLSAPAYLRGIWEGTNGPVSLKQDMLEVITLANRLDIFNDYSVPAAQRVFVELQALARDRVNQNLSDTMTSLRADMIASVDQTQNMLLIVAGIILAVGAITSAWVFMPMMRNIAQSQDALEQANADMEAARRKAESADRAKSEFLANMSHEIRTPMNGVLGMAELLVRTDLDKRQQTFADVILKSGAALLTIINDILDFSKIDAGQLTLDPAPFRLGEAIEDVVTLVSGRVAEKDLELIVRVEPGLPNCVVGDVGRIRQIVTNLVGNGVKFTERGHVLVDVSGKTEGNVAHVTIRVEDTGIGIPEAMMERIFDKFSQVDASSTRRHEGTGLGLAITSRLVELMGGRIGVESTLGQGSVFFVTIPLEIHEDAEVERPVPVDVSGARVLVIDDNKVNRDILLEQLRGWNFECAAAEDGEIGLAFLQRCTEIGARVDCIILDYQMPGLNGVEVAKRIAANPATAQIPVVLLTSVDQAVTGKISAEIGISAHLNKPARSAALLETLVSVMQTARHRKSPQPQLVVNRPVEIANFDAAVRQSKQQQVDILVAEDNEVNQLVFSQILNGLGISYRIAENGRIALEMYRTLNPRLILMDVSMPQMNGLEATAAIRREEAETGGRTPIIGVTAHALKGDREKCIEAGMDDYLSKPVSPDKLASKISTWLDRQEGAAGKPHLELIA